MHKWLFFSNDISGSYGIGLFPSLSLSLFLFQASKQRSNLDLHSIAGWINATRDRRLRFQLPSFRFASYWNSMCIVELSVSQTEKRSHRWSNKPTNACNTFQVFSFLFFGTGMVFKLFLHFLIAVHSNGMVFFSYTYKEYRLWWRGAMRSLCEFLQYKHTFAHKLIQRHVHFNLFNVLVSNSKITYWHLFWVQHSRVLLFMGVASIGFAATHLEHWWLTEYERYTIGWVKAVGLLQHLVLFLSLACLLLSFSCSFRQSFHTRVPKSK